MVPRTKALGAAIVAMTKAGGSVSYKLGGRLVYSGGQLIVTVPASLVRGAFDALHEPGVTLPPSPGIIAATAKELSRLDPDKITERGHSVRYNVGALHEHEPTGGAWSKVYYLEVLSPELRTIRQTYGLGSYPDGADSFRLVVGVRGRGVLADNDISKISACLEDLDPDEYDLEAVKRAAEGEYSSIQEEEREGTGPTRQLHPLPVLPQKIDRSAFLYSDPSGDSGQFAQCATCHFWTGEHRTCFLHAGDVEVPGTASCGYYVHGHPQEELAGKELGAVTPEESGLVNRPVRCENCCFYDVEGKDCELYESLNQAYPSVFDLDEKVNRHGCCAAQSEKTQEKSAGVPLPPILANLEPEKP